MPSQTASIQKSLTLTKPPSAKQSGSGDLTRSGSGSVKRRSRPLRRSFIGDTIAISIILAATNYLLFRGDPCWLNSNPTPLLLLPILIGGRYGSGAGLFAGLLATGAVFGVMHLLGITPGALVESHVLALAAFPIIGLLCGEIHSFFKAKTLALSERCDQLESLHGRASANLELYADSNNDLQRRLAVHGVRFTSLDSEIRQLMTPSKNDLFTDALSLLNRVTDISEAAFYSVGKKGQLTREALLGNGDELPETLSPKKVDIIAEAIAEKEMVTCRGLWEKTPLLSSRHLAAIPLMDPHGEVGAILLVRRLPFHCVTWQHFAQIETICQWIANVAGTSQRSSGESQRDFKQTVELCFDAYRKHALPSTAIHFIAKEDSKLTQERLDKIVTPLLRKIDVTDERTGKQPNLAVILPMEGLSEAERLADQVCSAADEELDFEILESEGFESLEKFLSRLEN